MELICINIFPFEWTGEVQSERWLLVWSKYSGGWKEKSEIQWFCVKMLVERQSWCLYCYCCWLIWIVDVVTCAKALIPG